LEERTLVNSFRVCLLIAVVLALPWAAHARTNEPGWSMEAALKQLDRQGSDLESVFAEVAISWASDAGGDERLASGRIFINRESDAGVHADRPQPEAEPGAVRRPLAKRHREAASLSPARPRTRQ
jgi:hypothetical protein